MFKWLTKRRRGSLLQTPLPAEWHAIITRNIPYVALLPAADRDELIGHIQVFLAEKKDIHDRQNVVLHEFAHQLDQEAVRKLPLPTSPHDGRAHDVGATLPTRSRPTGQPAESTPPRPTRIRDTTPPP